jgi:hypothetical protein
MSMFSEITTDANVFAFVKEIEKELKANEDNPEVCKALKKIGRFALTQFDWSFPEWAREYETLFAE